MQFAWYNVTLLRYHKTVSVNHWICARNSKHACYCAVFLLMCSKGYHGGWGREVGGLILTCSKHWHTGVLNVCESASQQLAVVLLSCWIDVIDFVSCEWFSCFTLMLVLPWCDDLQWTGCSEFRINTELGRSISLSPMFILCTFLEGHYIVIINLWRYWEIVWVCFVYCIFPTGILIVCGVCMHTVLCVIVCVCVCMCVLSVIVGQKLFQCTSCQFCCWLISRWPFESLLCCFSYIYVVISMCSNWRNST